MLGQYILVKKLERNMQMISNSEIFRIGQYYE